MIVEALVVALVVVSLIALAALRAWWQARALAKAMSDAFLNSLSVVERLSYEKTTAEGKLALLEGRPIK